MAPFGCLLIVQVLLPEFLFLCFAMGDDVSEVTWAHAVNSRHMLETELAGAVDFLEADVSMGHVMGQEFGPPIPIMAHPPNTTSDLSLDTWLDIVIARRTGKGVKLDFKSIETLKPSMKLLESHAQK
ncbi:protein FAM151B-like, partial [Stegodyphus dumicola]|uniref:protein FAM151B-like n=1 Tax=Stegodyphus dumicola TaxID=202533 RepID=UPI0015AF85D0